MKKIVTGFLRLLYKKSYPVISFCRKLRFPSPSKDVSHPAGRTEDDRANLPTVDIHHDDNNDIDDDDNDDVFPLDGSFRPRNPSGRSRINKSI